MKNKLLFLFPFLLLQIGSFACGGLSQVVYSGEMTYSQSTANPLTYTIYVTLDFDLLDSLPTDSILLNWGDNETSAVFATSSRVDTAAKNYLGYERYFTHVYEGTHTYAAFPANGQFVVGLASQFRMSEVTNIASQGQSLSFYIETIITADTSAGFVNHAPVLNLSTIGFSTLGNSFHDNMVVYDADGDSVTFDNITPLIDHDLSTFEYYTPQAYCQILSETSPYTVDPNTGSVSWDNPCGQGVFTIAILVREFRNGRLLSSSVRDKNIFISNIHSSDIPSLLNENIFRVFPNPATSYIQMPTEETLSISIVNVLGETIRKQNFASSTTIDIADLPSGIYFVTDENHSFTSKFVKE
ncbi:MAG: T9SS type A sorting domain-containing protein [Bacteroidetes bacterium]|nr:T9SS type A sorting domain-containing protein [Bacteroidota bacterium]